VTGAQGLTGTLIVSVKDEQAAALAGARARLSSPALIGGATTLTTNEKGQLRYPALPPGPYALEIAFDGFTTYRETDISIGAGAAIERTAVLKLAGLAESVVVEGAGSRIEARDSGFGTRFSPEDIKAIPTRRASMFDFMRAAPGISATSPSSGVSTTVSAFGSGTNENQFLIDGTNFTCPCNGIARSEPGIDFIQEVQVQSVGASVEFGNVQGAVINVVTRQGGERFLYDASYYAQTSGLTSQPVVLPLAAPAKGQSGYERSRYRDLTTDLGGPVVHDRLWFFGGYQYLRDYDSQPGTDPAFPRAYEQNKVFGKLTWRLTPRLQLLQSFHDEEWVNPEQPTLAKPFETTLRAHASVPAMTFGHLTHTLSDRTLWDVRVGRFVYTRADDPSSGNRSTPNRTDGVTGVWSGGPQTFSALTLIRTTAKATISHYRTGLLGADHQWKAGGQVERGEHQTPSIIPSGEWFRDSNGQPSQSISSAPSNSGGMFITAAAFASDALTVGNRLTLNAGLRFDHSRAISQDLPAVDLQGHETDAVIRGLGTLYTWNVVSPRLGVTAKLSADGRTVLRASYGRFNQGVLTGELGIVHPGITPVTTAAFDPATGGYTRILSVIDPKSNLQLDSGTRPPHTNEYSVGVDREIGRRFASAVAYVHKDGDNFIGWTDIGGQYSEASRTLADGRSVPAFDLVNSPAARRYLLTNQAGYSMTYNGLVMVVERRRSRGWQAFGSYTLSRTEGLQPSIGTNAASAPQVSTVAPPPVPIGLPFGRDPNDLTNAFGRLPNDRPHVFRAMGAVEVPKTGITIAANLGYFSGKPWAAAALISVTQNNLQRILIEPRGLRRLSSQSLLDLRASRTIAVGGLGHVELLLDVLNVLNNTAEEGIATDVLAASNFGQPTAFVDPRRAMISARVNLGR
jgi:hypothetical protein